MLFSITWTARVNGTVNLTNLVSGASPAIPQSYLASSANYQTRLYHFDQPIYTSSTSSPWRAKMP